MLLKFLDAHAGSSLTKGLNRKRKLNTNISNTFSKGTILF